MASKVLFITARKLKENTTIDSNVDDDLLVPYILKSQDIHIHQTLGTDLYNLLKTQVSGATLTVPNTTLLEDYIQPALIEWALYESLPFIALKLNNKTLGRNNGEFLEAGSLEDLKYIRNASRDLAEFYTQRIIGFIKENINDYPTYHTNTGLDKIVPNSSSYFGGIYLGNGRSKDCDFGLDLPR